MYRSLALNYANSLALRSVPFTEKYVSNQRQYLQILIIIIVMSSRYIHAHSDSIDPFGGYFVCIKKLNLRLSEWTSEPDCPLDTHKNGHILSSQLVVWVCNPEQKNGLTESPTANTKPSFTRRGSASVARFSESR